MAVDKEIIAPVAAVGDSDSMHDNFRDFDWSATPMGAAVHWPQSLRTLVDLLLASAQPMFIAWGAQRTLLHQAICDGDFCKPHRGDYCRQLGVAASRSALLDFQEKRQSRAATKAGAARDLVTLAFPQWLSR